MKNNCVGRYFVRVFLFGFMAIALHAQAQSPDSSTEVDENERWETRDYFNEGRQLLSQLDDQDRRRDGKYGWDISWGPSRQFISPTFIGTSAKAATCQADLTVIATARASRTYLSLDGTNIVTRTTFDVDRVLGKHHAIDKPTSSLRVYLNRGELEIEGKVVRIAAPDYPEFKSGEQFVLLLQAKDAHFKLVERAGAIKNGHVYYPAGYWRNVKSGIRLDALIAQIAVAEPSLECN